VTGRLRRCNPRLMELAMPEPAGVEQIRQQLLSPKQALLHYVLAEEQSYLWLLTRNDLQLYSLPDEATLREAYHSLSKALAIGQATHAGFVMPARQLYEKLLGPIAEAVGSYDELIIVADGFLGYLPFEVLLTESPNEMNSLDLSTLPYLLREKTITYAPSASFLAFHAKQRNQKENWHKDALLFGDPVYANERSAALASRAVLALQSFERLRQTREEVTEIASELVADSERALLRELQDLQQATVRSGSVSGSRFDLYLGNEVNEARLKSDLSGYRIVHLATHGYFDPEYPWFSGLVLSSAAAEEGGGFLNILELGMLKLDAQLVFLSARETRKGQMLRSEGVQSTARSFLIAGAQSVIATQWSVRDDVASVLARIFYRNLFGGATASRALCEAKLFLINGGLLDDIHEKTSDRGVSIPGRQNPQAGNQLAHPSFWAPFVIFGGPGSGSRPR
jgi:CHAT domain-containing protein